MLQQELDCFAEAATPADLPQPAHERLGARRHRAAQSPAELDRARLGPRRAARAPVVWPAPQFLLPGWRSEAVRALLARAAARGVELKWFGAPEPVAFTSRYDAWRFAPVPHLPRTDAVLAGLIDMRLPLTFSASDCALIARIIRAEVSALWQQDPL